MRPKLSNELGKEVGFNFLGVAQTHRRWWVGRRREKRIRRRRMDRSIVCFSRAKVPPPPHSLRLSKITCCNRSRPLRAYANLVGHVTPTVVLHFRTFGQIVEKTCRKRQSRSKNRCEWRQKLLLHSSAPVAASADPKLVYGLRFCGSPGFTCAEA